MRILHLFDHSVPIQSGYSFRSRAIIEGQRALGWQTAHVTSPKHLPHKGGRDDEIEGLVFHRSDYPGGAFMRAPISREWLQINAAARRLDEIARSFKPDLIQAHSPALNGIAALRIARKHGLPLLYEVRAFWEDAAVSHGTARANGLRYRLTRALETYVVRRADAVTVICEGLRDDLSRRGVPAEKITVIPNAVDCARFDLGLDAEKDTELMRDLGLEDTDVLGFIGSFYDYEGLDLLIAAMPAILERRPSTRLLLVGGGPCDKALRRQATDLGLNGKIRFTGRVPHRQVERYYSLVDIFVYPRKAIRLTELVTPLKPLEAMAQYKLVAASDIGGHRELISDGETGVLFAPDDPDALADKVVRLLQDRARWRDLQRRARDYVERERNWPRSVANYRQALARLFAG